MESATWSHSILTKFTTVLINLLFFYFFFFFIISVETGCKFFSFPWANRFVAFLVFLLSPAGHARWPHRRIITGCGAVGRAAARISLYHGRDGGGAHNITAADTAYSTPRRCARPSARRLLRGRTVMYPPRAESLSSTPFSRTTVARPTTPFAPLSPQPPCDRTIAICTYHHSLVNIYSIFAVCVSACRGCSRWFFFFFNR